MKDAEETWLKLVRISALRALWWTAWRIRAWGFPEWFRCRETNPVQTWVPPPDPDEPEYFRAADTWTQCLRFTGHRALCWGNRDDLGIYQRHGATFKPEPHVARHARKSTDRARHSA